MPAAVPAHWSPERLATTILVNGDPDQFAALLPDEARTLAALEMGETKQLIYDCGSIRLRIRISREPDRREPAFVVPADAAAPIRLDAAQQLIALQAGRSTAFSRPPFAPTLYHRRQLVRLLAIADAARAGAAARDIAFGIVFPNTRLSAARDWKGSNEQRQTRRLTREAERMIDGGFWRLPCFAPE